MKSIPETSIITGTNMAALRSEMGLNQSRFWNPIGVTQSGASRYESGRPIPQPTRIALAMIYANEIKKHAPALRT